MDVPTYMHCNMWTLIHQLPYPEIETRVLPIVYLQLIRMQDFKILSTRRRRILVLVLSVLEVVVILMANLLPRYSEARPLIDKDNSSAAMTIEWFSWLAEVGMQKHGRLMVSNQLDEDDIEHFNHDLLRSIGVDNAKDRLLILNQKNKHIQRRSTAKNRFDFLKLAAEAQSAIIERVQSLHVDEEKLVNWIRTTWPLCNRQILMDQGYLSTTAPDPGSTAAMANYDRTQRGTGALNTAKDILWASLYGTTESNVAIQRVERELLVITIPGRKAFVFNFFQAVTEVGALGTWRDPENRCHDQDESNMLLQVEYGESASEIVGDAIMVCIHLINLLEVNEVVLYARSSNIEQSTLLTELYFEKHQRPNAVLHELEPK